MIPATKFGERLAGGRKPRIAAAIAPEASSDAASRLMPSKLGERDGDADRDDRGVDQPADEAQAGVGRGRELAADDRRGHLLPAVARARAVEQRGDHERPRRSRTIAVIQALLSSQNVLARSARHGRRD